MGSSARQPVNDGLPLFGFAGLACPAPEPEPDPEPPPLHGVLGSGDAEPLGDGEELGNVVGMGKVGEASALCAVAEGLGDALGRIEGDELGDGEAAGHDGLDDGNGLGNDGPGLGLAAGADCAAIRVAPPATTSVTRANDVRSLLMALHLTGVRGTGLSIGGTHTEPGETEANRALRAPGATSPGGPPGPGRA